MIYKSYNFVESYSNADGSKKNAIVLNELGAVIRTQPSAVISALKDAGVKVPKRASRRDLVRLIVSNKRNRKLSENLAILIVAKATANNGILPKGVDKFDNLIDPSGGNPTMGPQTQAEAQASAQQFGVGPTAQTNQERAGNFFKNIGDFFRGRQEARAGQTRTTQDGTAEQTNFQRFQNWFNRNRGTIGQVAQTTYDSIQQSGNIGQGGNFGNQQLPPFREPTWVERNRNFVIIGVVAILGGVVYFATRGGKKGK
jgi:hypothetical protein